MPKADHQTLQRLKEAFQYNYKTGKIIRAVDGGRHGKYKAGTVVGCVNCYGYLQVNFERKSWLLHRIAWALYHEVWPDEIIDHINGNKQDNRICNLRLADTAINIQNQTRPNSRNQCGFFGVSKQSKKKWRAKIKANGKKYNLGSFESPEAAHQAYLKAKRELHKGCTI